MASKGTATQFHDGELEPIDTRVAIRFDDVDGGYQTTPQGILVVQTRPDGGINTRLGTVVGVGPNVKQVKVGDRVFVGPHSLATGFVERGTPGQPDFDRVLVLDEGQLVSIFRKKK
jgi:hypothetical protein